MTAGPSRRLIHYDALVPPLMLMHRSALQLRTSPNRRQRKQKKQNARPGPPIPALPSPASLLALPPQLFIPQSFIYPPDPQRLSSSASNDRHYPTSSASTGFRSALSRNGEGREEEVWLGRCFAHSFDHSSGRITNQRAAVKRSAVKRSADCGPTAKGSSSKGTAFGRALDQRVFFQSSAGESGGVGRRGGDETPILQRHQTVARRSPEQALLRFSKGPECSHRKALCPCYTPNRRTRFSCSVATRTPTCGIFRRLRFPEERGGPARETSHSDISGTTLRPLPPSPARSWIFWWTRSHQTTREEVVWPPQQRLPPITHSADPTFSNTSVHQPQTLSHLLRPSN